jgi:3-deoxy-D-manno-octulosonic-acid transferase
VTTARSRGRVALAHASYGVLVLLALLLAAPVWAVKACRDRRQLRLARERLGWLPDGAPAGRPVWIHAVSVGEVKAARPLVQALRAHDPTLPLSLSTSTPAGYETARRAFPDLYVFHAPLDLSLVVHRVLRRLRPRLLVLLELEVWPALVRAADEAGIGPAIVNGRMTEKSWRNYRRWSWWLPEFDRLCLVAAQDETYGRRIADLGVPESRIRVTGNLKHELGEPPTREAVAALAARTGLGDGHPVFVAGSTHAGEDELAAAAWQAAGGGAACHFVLVPRHRERVPDVLRTLKRMGWSAPSTRRASPGAAGRACWSSTRWASSRPSSRWPRSSSWVGRSCPWGATTCSSPPRPPPPCSSGRTSSRAGPRPSACARPAGSRSCPTARPCRRGSRRCSPTARRARPWGGRRAPPSAACAAPRPPTWRCWPRPACSGCPRPERPLSARGALDDRAV